jgi:hypothetical protein
MSLVESVPLQTKISELEQRIEKLEKERGVVFTKTTVTRTRHSDGPGDGVFGEAWDKMWENFHKVMKAAFQ